MLRGMWLGKRNTYVVAVLRLIFLVGRPHARQKALVLSLRVCRLPHFIHLSDHLVPRRLCVLKGFPLQVPESTRAVQLDMNR